MKIYLLRHGKTREHERRVRQHPESDLGTEGRKQARRVAKRLAGEQIEVIISSPWPRALTTAKIVAEKLGVPLVVEERIHELIHSPRLDGLPYDHELSKKFLDEVGREGKNVDWKFRGEGESIRDVLNRAREFKKRLLKKHAGRNVLIVSHGYFMSAIVALFLAGDETGDQILRDIAVSLLSYENTALSLLEYHEVRDVWRLMYFNDYSHLKST